MSSGREFLIALQQSGKTVGVERAEGWELGRRVGTWQRVRGLRSVSGQSRAFCCWELLLLPSSRNCDTFLPGMMSIGQAAWICDAGTGVALSFVSRDFEEREVVSACQKVIHELQCDLTASVELCGASGEIGAGRGIVSGLFVKELMVWGRHRGPQLWHSVKNKSKQDPDILFLIYSA